MGGRLADKRTRDNKRSAGGRAEERDGEKNPKACQRLLNRKQRREGKERRGGEGGHRSAWWTRSREWCGAAEKAQRHRVGVFKAEEGEVGRLGRKMRSYTQDVDRVALLQVAALNVSPL